MGNSPLLNKQYKHFRTIWFIFKHLIRKFGEEEIFQLLIYQWMRCLFKVILK